MACYQTSEVKLAEWRGGDCDNTAGEPGRAETEIARFGAGGEFVLRMAVSGADRLTCWKLVYDEYLAHGYTHDLPLPYRYTAHDALPDTGTFLVERDGEPVGTITVYPDSPLGLPAEEVFRTDVEPIREAGRSPVEIGRLTIAPAFAKDRQVLMKTLEIPFLCARRVMGATDVVITVNPKHQNFYNRMMLFETLSGEKTYGSVCGAPAVLMRVDLGFQGRVIRWVHGEGACPAGDLPRHTIYRSFWNEAEERAVEERIRRIRQPLPAEFLRRYFVRERRLIPSLKSSLRYLFEACYRGYGLTGVGELVGVST